MTTRLRFPVLAGVLGIACVGLLYLTTLQTDINGYENVDMLDVGELQTALSTWGTTHPTGYPFFTIAGNILVMAGRLVGLAPALVTSLFTLVVTLGTLALLYALVWQATHHVPAALAAVAVLAIAPVFWLNSVITEVYALNVFLIVCIIFVAWRMHQGDRVSPVALALLLGLALSHHRTGTLVVPAVIVLLWPKTVPRLELRRVLPVVLAVLAPFALYAYIPLRIMQKAPWLYEQQRWGLAEAESFTLQGFVAYVMGREYATFINPPTTLPLLANAVGRVCRMWVDQVGLVVLVASIAGLLLSLRGKNQRLGAALVLLVVIFGGFGVAYPVRATAEMLMPSLAILAMGAGLLAGWAAERLGAKIGLAVAALLVLSVVLRVPAEWRSVTEITKAQGGREVIAAAQRIADPCPTILSHWGVDWFAFNYAHISTHELACARIEPPHADIRRSWARGERVYVSSHFFYQMPLAELEAKVGPVRLQSAAYGMVQVSDRPALSVTDPLSGTATNMGNVMTLLGYNLERSVQDGRLYLALYWRADAAQRGDYSVFVHVSDKAAIAGPADIVSQADSLHPVYGWYPTSRWAQGEIVRDDYVISEDAARPAQMIAVGLYRSENGAFTNLGRVEIAVAF